MMTDIYEFPLNKMTFTVRETDVKVVIDSRYEGDPMITLTWTLVDAIKINKCLSQAISELQDKHK